MSYRAMLQHRCRVKRLTESNVGGMPVHSWTTVETDVRCFLDLNFVRRGKDPVWTPESGTSESRSGVMFFQGDALIRSGDRIEMTSGPVGTFQLDMSVDEAWTPHRRHHLEVYAAEVPRQLARGEA